MKKLLVWDGDETLWNGTILEGDDVTLPEGRFELCQELFNRGVVQSVASFNTIADVEAALHRFGLSNFFLVPQASLDGVSKSDMITIIKEQLNISKYSDIVFVDDNPHNREEVRISTHCMVIAPDEIEPAVLDFFTKSEYTQEDRDRVRMYQSEIARSVAGQAHGEDKIEFLKSLHLRANISLASNEQMPRVHQLIERANRLAAKHPSKTSDNDHEKWVLTAVDDFGDYGLSGVIYTQSIYPVLYIDILVISCRLQGKGLGSAFLGSLINYAVSKQHERISIMYIETEYNVGIRSLLEWYKFNITRPGDGHSLIADLELTGYVQLPDWITLEEQWKLD